MSKTTTDNALPTGWAHRSLGEVVDFLDGRRRPVKDSDRAKMRGDVPYYGASGIVDYVNDFLFDDDLILLGEDGENILSRTTRLAFRVIGRVWVNNHAHVLKAKPGYDTGYLAEYLESLSYDKYNSGTAQPKLNKAACFGIPVLAPPAKEQRAIAAALADVDALLTKLDQLIAKKRDLKQAAMQQLLTGHRRLSGFSEPWDERALQSVVTRLEAGVSVRSVEGDGGGADCFVLKTSAVADGNFDASERKPVIPADRGRVRCPVRAGTVLVSRMNTPDLVGEVGFVDRDHPNSFLPDRLWAASVPKGAVSARWLSYVLSSSEYKQRLRDVATGTSGSMKNISKGAFLGISVKVPTFDEQSAIAQVLSDMDAELVALEARSDKTRQLKQGMMQALLTGRIRLA